ncbi:MAG: hypothetical protein ABFD92_13075 [Planctomycetaceae bacterium]|nr:hypothetical protein [Planctomycetaceae bacterium]
MNELALKERLAELREAICASGLPDAKYVSDQLLTSDLICGETDSVEADLDQLRLQMKYMLFDLEATRRENRYLRQMLETRPPNAPGETPGF